MKRSGAKARLGFTMLELLVVISIMAILATLAVGAAGKAIKTARNRRIDAMVKGLELALNNYRAKENEWPFKISDLIRDRDDAGKYWACGVNNVRVFKNLYYGRKGASQNPYLDASAFLTIQVRMNGVSTRSLQAVLSLGGYEDRAALGYPNPSNTSDFRYFCVSYTPLTDTVKVVREGWGHSCRH